MQSLRVASTALLLLAGSAAFAQSADRIWIGGTILTMNDPAMRAEAIAESAGRILRVGSRAEVMALKGRRTRLIDLNGRTLRTSRDWMATNAAVVDKTRVIVHQSGHLATVNAAMLKEINYDARTRDPAGGVIQRKPGGTEPNGTLEETALFAAIPVVLRRIGPEGLKTFAREGARLWARFDYTTAQEGRAIPPIVELLRQVAAEGGFANDINAYPDVLVDRDFIKANQSPGFTNRFRVAGAKLTIDGSPQGFTAWRDRPYYKPVGNYPKGYSRYASASAEDVMGAVQWATENGIQIIARHPTTAARTTRCSA